MKKLSRTIAYASAAFVCLGAASSAQAVTIILNNLGGVDPGTAVYHGFYAAKHYWESVLTDDVTVKFNVQFTSAFASPNTLGDASSSFGNKTVATWKNAIIADATTSVDASAIANLAPVQSANVSLNTSLQKALGIYTGVANNTDATIRFNSSRKWDFYTADGFSGAPASDFVSVAVHEIGHALGFTSNVGPNTTNANTPRNTDLFRYKNGSWNISYGGDPYFSIDGGATNLFGNSYYSAGPDGFQTSHWKEAPRQHDGVSCTITTPQIGIMDPTGGLCQEGIVTANDLAAFDALGWDLDMNILNNPNFEMRTSQIMLNYLALPEPGTWAMMIVGFGFVGGAMRRTRRETPATA